MKFISGALVWSALYASNVVFAQDCITDLGDILNAEGPLTQNQIAENREYILCPDTVYEVGIGQGGNIVDGQFPIVVRSNAHVKCGEDGSSANNCVITAGQFAVFLNTYDFFGDLSMDNVIIQGITIQDISFAGDVPIACQHNRGSIEFRDIIYRVSYKNIFCFHYTPIIIILNVPNYYTVIKLQANNAAPSFAIVQLPYDRLTSAGGGRRKPAQGASKYGTGKFEYKKDHLMTRRRLADQTPEPCSDDTNEESSFAATIRDSLIVDHTNVPGSTTQGRFDGGTPVIGTGSVATTIDRTIFRNNAYNGEDNVSTYILLYRCDAFLIYQNLIFPVLCTPQCFGVMYLHQSCGALTLTDNCFEGNTFSGNGAIYTDTSVVTVSGNNIDAPLGSDFPCPFIAHIVGEIGDPFKMSSCVGDFDAPTCQARSATPAPAPAPAPGGGGLGAICFPGDAVVQLEGQSTNTPISDLKIGDKVLVEDGKYSTVYSFGHRNEDVLTTYLQFNQQLEISEDHMVHVDGNFAPASTVKLGSTLRDASGNGVVVTDIATVQKHGAFSPFTLSGKVVVNGMLASNFIGFQNSGSLSILGVTEMSWQWMAQAFKFPHRFVYGLGLARKEYYTKTGISTWVDLPHRFTLWLMEQPSMIVGAVMVPVVGIYFVFCVCEMAISHYYLLVTAAAAMAAVIMSRRRTCSKQKQP